MLIYDTLKKDHEKIKDLLDRLLAVGDDQEETEDLIEEIRDELIPHARAEETVLYNSLRALDAAKGIVIHSFQEHIEAEMLLRTLQIQSKVEANWKKTAQKLKLALEHHIEEEETRIFPAAQQLFTAEEAEVMNEVFEQLKPKVRTEGVFKTTVDLLANMMPPKLTGALKSFNLDSHR